MARVMTGAEMVIKALTDQGVEHVFGYPGGAVLPIYDELFQQEKVQHILVRQEGGALHAAEGYARSTGKVGVALVTSGPGATNAVTGLTDALMDSIPLVCITGQVPTHLIGNDAFQECDTVGITRPCTKHNWLVKNINDLSRILHEAFYIAKAGRPGPVVVDIPKDIQFASGNYVGPSNIAHKTYKPKVKPDLPPVQAAVELMASAKRPVFYTGGGVINSGPKASQLLRELVRLTGYPITSTLMGLGAYPASDKQWLGMLGMHGTYEANLAMHDCDVMINIGARFDDRITGRIDAFSPGSKKIHVDIDASSINKNIHADIPIIGDCTYVLEEMLRAWKAKAPQLDKAAHKAWWKEIDGWRAKKSLSYKASKDVIMPQYACRAAACADQGPRHLHHDRGRPASDVGRAVPALRRAEPLDDVRRPRHDGLWSACRHRRADGASEVARHRRCGRRLDPDEHPGVLDGRAVQPAGQGVHPEQRVHGHGPAVAAASAWQPSVAQLHRKHCLTSSSWRRPMAGRACAAIIRPISDEAILEMINHKGPVIFDCRVAKLANCFPMIPSGKAHNEMLLGENVSDEEVSKAIGKEGKVLV